MNIDELIQPNKTPKDLTKYYTMDVKNREVERITKIINDSLGKIEETHDKNLENKLKEDGILIFENFLTTDEVESLKSQLVGLDGYNAHVPRWSDKNLRKISETYNFQTLSYSMDNLLKNDLIVKKVSDNNLISLVQSYLGCFPTLYSLNSWWYINTNEPTYGTQKNHRDYDDYRFLAFFIYLTDVDDNNSPHVFYKGTQNGSINDNYIKITGKAGTAILADTYGIHRADPLIDGRRLVCWWRYGLYENDMYHNDENYLYKVDKNIIFDKIEDNRFNQHLFRLVVK